MSEEYKPCQLRRAADDSVKKSTRELCFALIDTETRDIINVYSPGTAWTTAVAGARNIQCGYASIVCDVSYEVLPQYKVYKALEDLTAGGSSQKAKVKESNFSKFVEVAVSNLATRKFTSNTSTNFLGIKVDDEIVKVFPRGTPVEQISSLSLILEGDIVLVKAKAIYDVTGLAKIEKTFEQLRQS